MKPETEDIVNLRSHFSRCVPILTSDDSESTAHVFSKFDFIFYFLHVSFSMDGKLLQWEIKYTWTLTTLLIIRCVYATTLDNKLRVRKTGFFYHGENVTVSRHSKKIIFQISRLKFGPDSQLNPGSGLLGSRLRLSFKKINLKLISLFIISRLDQNLI
jgi:hypothetical protein